MRIFSMDTVIVTHKVVAQRYASFLLQTHWCGGTKKILTFSLVTEICFNCPICCLHFFLKEYLRNRSIWHSVINRCCKRSVTTGVYPSYAWSGFFSDHMVQSDNQVFLPSSWNSNSGNKTDTIMLQIDYCYDIVCE